MLAYQPSSVKPVFDQLSTVLSAGVYSVAAGSIRAVLGDSRLVFAGGAGGGGCTGVSSSGLALGSSLVTLLELGTVRRVVVVGTMSWGGRVCAVRRMLMSLCEKEGVW